LLVAASTQRNPTTTGGAREARTLGVLSSAGALLSRKARKPETVRRTKKKRRAEDVEKRHLRSAAPTGIPSGYLGKGGAQRSGRGLTLVVSGPSTARKGAKVLMGDARDFLAPILERSTKGEAGDFETCPQQEGIGESAISPSRADSFCLRKAGAQHMQAIRKFTSRVNRAHRP